jgi:hypothetical protein
MKADKHRSNLNEVMQGRKNSVHLEKGKRPKDKQNMKNNLKRGIWE